jgi:hypothetical protein
MRPLKSGLDYFPHDTDASQDEKLEALTALHGNDGYAAYFRLLELIYKTSDGGLDLSDARIVALLPRRLHVSRKRFDKILQDALSLGLFDKSEFSERKLLTSSGIRKRFQVVAKMRQRWRLSKINELQEFSLQGFPRGKLDKENPTKQSKEKERKVHPPPLTPPPVDEEDAAASEVESRIGRTLTPTEKNELQQLSRNDGFSEAVQKLHGSVKAPIPFLRAILLNPKDFSRGRNSRATFEHTANDVQRFRELEATLSLRDRQRGEYPNDGVSAGKRQPFERLKEEREARGTLNLCSDCGGAYWSLERHDCPVTLAEES